MPKNPEKYLTGWIAFNFESPNVFSLQGNFEKWCPLMLFPQAIIDIDQFLNNTGVFWGCLSRICIFFQFLFILRFGGRGEMTYINGPPNPPLDLLAHLCSIIYMYTCIFAVCNIKQERWKNYYNHIGDDFRGHAYLQIPLS